MSSSKNSKIQNKSGKIKCDTCKKEIPRREYLTCQGCKTTLDLGCANVPFVRFNIMEADRKKKWKCDGCLNKPTTKPKPKSPPPFSTPSSSPYDRIIEDDVPHENITIRQRNKLHASVELLDKTGDESITDNSLTQLENTRLSLPDLNIVDSKELQDEINTLKTKLASAHMEIDRLNMQVTGLQKKLDEQQRKSQVLKQLLTEPTVRKSTPRKQNNPKGSLTNTTQEQALPDPIMCESPTKPNPNGIESSNEKIRPQSPRPALDISQISNTNPSATNIIYIFGSQQCVGLGTQLYQSRLGNKLGQYSVRALTKPNATAEDILNVCDVEDSPQNYLILCAGEHDDNPTKILIEFSSVLKKFRFINIIVLNVNSNKFLNTDKLNKCLKNLCRNIPNCKFIENIYYDQSQQCKSNISYKKYLKLTCQKINFIIDYHNYSSKYLSCKGIRDIIKSNRINAIDKSFKKSTPKKGTIPYYFPIQNRGCNMVQEVTVPPFPEEDFFSVTHRSLIIES